MNKKTPPFRQGSKKYSRDASSGSSSSHGRGKDGYVPKRDSGVASDGKKYRNDKFERPNTDYKSSKSDNPTGRDGGSAYGQRPPRVNKDRFSDSPSGRDGGSAYGQRPPRVNKERFSGSPSGRDGGSGYGQRPPRDNRDRVGDNPSGRDSGSQYGQRPPRVNKDRFSDSPSGRDGGSGYGQRPPRDNRDRVVDNPSGRDSGSQYGQRPPRVNKDRFSGNPSGRDGGSAYGQRPPRVNKERFSGSPSGRDGGSGYGQRPPRVNKDRFSDSPSGRDGRSGYGQRPPRDNRDRVGDNPSGRDSGSQYGQRPPQVNRERFSDNPSGERRPYQRERFNNEASPGYKKYGKDADDRYNRSAGEKRTYKPLWKKRDDKNKSSGDQFENNQNTTIRLNKYIANSGICSRRDADLLITSGAVSVNGVVITTLGSKVNKHDTVVYNEKQLTAERKVYILLNKPKDYITTLDDPQGRKTVMSLIKGVGNVRLFPVGRLDRNTTGLLMLTNDGEMAKKLTHPKHTIKKLYHVELDKPLAKSDMNEIASGIEIDGEKVVPDSISYVATGEDKKQIGIEIHSGQNRVVRRLFESLEYKVEKLDRVLFAGLSKRDLPRGHWRYLNEKEVNFLKMF